MKAVALGLVVAGVAAAPAVGQTGAPFGPTVLGRIVWPDHDLSQAQVRLYSDKGLTKLVDQFPTGGRGGTFVLIVDPGEYYLMAVVDDNGDGKVNAGDGLGFYGVAKLGEAGQEPKPLKVSADAMVSDVAIPIVAVLGDDGKPKAIAVEGPVVPAAPQGVPATIGGKITGADGLKAPVFVLVVRAADRSPAAVAEASAAEPSFGFTPAPGDYQVFALADLSGDGELGEGDAVGVYGVADWATPPQELPKLALASGAAMGGLEIALSGRLAVDGVVNPPQGTGSFRLDLSAMPAIVAGSVPFPAAGLKPVYVRLSADPGMSQPIASCECKPGAGSFVVAVPPRTYYLTAVVDEDDDGRVGPGDAIGFYGVDDLTSGKAPSAVAVSPASIVTGLKIRIIVRISDDGKPTPITPDKEGQR